MEVAETYGVYCIIERDKVAKEIPHLCKKNSP